MSGGKFRGESCFVKWDIRQTTFSRLVEWLRRSCQNSFLHIKREILRKNVLVEKLSVFLYLFQTISKKNSSVCISFSAMLWKLFCSTEGEIRFFFYLEGVRFTNISGHWVRTLMQSGNILIQFHQNCSLRSLCNIFVKKVFFVRFHQSSFWDIFWKKNRIFGGNFLAFYYVFCNFGKIFFYVSRGISEENFPHTMSFSLL